MSANEPLMTCGSRIASRARLLNKICFICHPFDTNFVKDTWTESVGHNIGTELVFLQFLGVSENFTIGATYGRTCPFTGVKRYFIWTGLMHFLLFSFDQFENS